MAEAPPIVHDVLRSPGQPLDPGTRAFMEPRFGYDFSRVRVHADSRAAKSAEAVNAQAYTVGSNIVFGANQGGVGNGSHQRLLAHELAHVVQQGGRPPGGSLQVAPANDSAEGAADRAADQVLAGGRASPATKAEGRLRRFGANPGCTAIQTNHIHEAINTASDWVAGALVALTANPLTSDTLSALQHNFGAAGTAANVGTIIARLRAGRADMLNNPYVCRNAANDPHCRRAGAYTNGAGSHASTICTNWFARPDIIGRAASVLHEAMHASDAVMIADSYSDYFGHRRQRFVSRDYPGTDPLINADSYGTLALELGKGAGSNTGNAQSASTPQSNPMNIPQTPALSPGGGSSGLLQRKSDGDSARAFGEPGLGYSFADKQARPQSVSSDILQREPKQPETKKEDAPAAAGSGQTPAASNKCPPLPAPGFEAILSPRDKLDTRKPNGRADFHAGVGEFNVGLGEVVDLSYHSVAGPHPSQNPPPEFFGGLSWIATGGTLTQAEKPDGTGTWTAPDIGSTVHLKVLTQAQNCTMADITVHVMEPTGVKMEKQGDTQKASSGKVTVGMFVHIRILPEDVSFTALKVNEGDAVIVGHGWWKFATGKHHCRGSGNGKYDGDNTCGPHNLIAVPAKGTMVSNADFINSGTSNWNKDWQQLKDPAERKRYEDGTQGTYEDPYDGGYIWDIPWLFSLGGGEAKQFTLVRVVANCDKTGKATIRKDDSEEASTELNDPATSFKIPPPPQ